MSAPAEDEVVQSMPDLIAKLLDAMAARRSSFRERAVLERAGAQAHRSLLPETVPNRLPGRPKHSGSRSDPARNSRYSLRSRRTNHLYGYLVAGRAAGTLRRLVRQGSCLRLLHRQSDPVKYYTIRHRRRTSDGFQCLGVLSGGHASSRRLASCSRSQLVLSTGCSRS